MLSSARSRLPRIKATPEAVTETLEMLGIVSLTLTRVKPTEIVKMEAK